MVFQCLDDAPFLQGDYLLFTGSFKAGACLSDSSSRIDGFAVNPHFPIVPISVSLYMYLLRQMVHNKKHIPSQSNLDRNRSEVICSPVIPGEMRPRSCTPAAMASVGQCRGGRITEAQVNLDYAPLCLLCAPLLSSALSQNIPCTPRL